MKNIFEVLCLSWSVSTEESALLPPEANDEQANSLSKSDLMNARLEIISLDCCFLFAESVQPKYQAQVVGIFPSHIPPIIKARRKEMKGKVESRFGQLRSVQKFALVRNVFSYNNLSMTDANKRQKI